jgi:hypothetical protein
MNKKLLYNNIVEVFELYPVWAADTLACWNR